MYLTYRSCGSITCMSLTRILNPFLAIAVSSYFLSRFLLIEAVCVAAVVQLFDEAQIDEILRLRFFGLRLTLRNIFQYGFNAVQSRILFARHDSFRKRKIVGLH